LDPGKLGMASFLQRIRAGLPQEKGTVMKKTSKPIEMKVIVVCGKSLFSGINK